MMELSDVQKEKVSIEVCHAWGDPACLSCVMAKIAVSRKIADRADASWAVKELVAAEAIFALELLPASFDTRPMVEAIEGALVSTEVIH